MAKKKVTENSSQLENTQTKFYDLNPILEKNADYNIIFGERSNGKTYALLKYGMERFWKSGKKEQMGIIRRWKEDITGRRATQMFSALVANGELLDLTDGQYNNILYSNGRWYFAKYSEKLNKDIPMQTPFCFAFSLSDVEHDKSISYPNITTIVFDEFLTRRYYLPDEFIIFMNVLSTIIRQRQDVKIFMLGNTVNKYCPYFKEMGLTHINKQEQGTIDIYNYGKSDLTVAVEYAESLAKHKKSNKFFAFDNENLQMITQGKWELALYPHLQTKYSQKDVVFTYFIEFNNMLLQCEIVMTDKENFTYVHEKTTPLKNPDTDLVYSLVHNQKANYRRRLMDNTTKLSRDIALYYALEKVFFQNNEVGEIVRNYIKESTKSQFAKTVG